MLGVTVFLRKVRGRGERDVGLRKERRGRMEEMREGGEREGGSAVWRTGKTNRENGGRSRREEK